MIIWTCLECGKKYGFNGRVGLATWHIGTCDVCGKLKAVTEPRDFGGFPEGLLDYKQMKRKKK